MWGSQSWLPPAFQPALPLAFLIFDLSLDR